MINGEKYNSFYHNSKMAHVRGFGTFSLAEIRTLGHFCLEKYVVFKKAPFLDWDRVNLVETKMLNKRVWTNIKKGNMIM